MKPPKQEKRERKILKKQLL